MRKCKHVASGEAEAMSQVTQTTIDPLMFEGLEENVRLCAGCTFAVISLLRYLQMHYDDKPQENPETKKARTDDNKKVH